MPDFIFADDIDLGKVVDKYEVFCSWSSTRPITNITQVTSDICGHKFSKLCGFNFKSNRNLPFPIFLIVYCPKTRSNYIRNDRGLHGWYIWQHRDLDDKMILSIHDLLAIYGFDISKFFLSDVFLRYLPVFRNQIVKAYTSQVLPFIDSIKGDQEVILPGGMKSTYSKKTAEFLARCAFDSVKKIGDVLKTDFEKPDAKKAKVAYNADKTYSLNMRNTLNTYDGSGDHKGEKMRESEISNGYPDYLINTIDDLENYIQMAFHEYGMEDRGNLVFRDKTGKELKIIDAKVLNNGINFTLD